MSERDDRQAPARGKIATSPAARLVWWTAAAAAVAIMVTTAGAVPRVARPAPYWVGDFRDGSYCQYATVFESTSVNPNLAAWGGLPACPGYMPYSQDPSQRVYLTRTPAPPPGAASDWVSHQELRTTDGPWFAGHSTDKSSVRLTPQQTLNGTFRMGAVRWFRLSFYLPNPGFSWPASGWYDLMDIHNTVKDPAGHDWPSLELGVISARRGPRYLAFLMDGGRAHASTDYARFLKLTDSHGSPVAARQRRPAEAESRRRTRWPNPFNRWHTLIVGVKFSDRGAIGDSPGWVALYFDGRRVYRKARPNVWANETAVYLTLQNYKSHAVRFARGATSSTIYFADVRIAYTLAGVGGRTG